MQSRQMNELREQKNEVSKQMHDACKQIHERRICESARGQEDVSIFYAITLARKEHLFAC